jgi:hypothetical protein
VKSFVLGKPKKRRRNIRTFMDAELDPYRLDTWESNSLLSSSKYRMKAGRGSLRKKTRSIDL